MVSNIYTRVKDKHYLFITENGLVPNTLFVGYETRKQLFTCEEVRWLLHFDCNGGVELFYGMRVVIVDEKEYLEVGLI